ncbi:M24 family metallopeptidase [Desulfoplanes formicivorans]|uniref:Peptidase M24 n=1 Tax=Desulfoplanes formicivorans TaxID=1592317 RepID=A0A194AHK1_9BACT|nr:Xaa-Pro peptidase family protein [Desulfoplanes formicivorans]GAU08561.1 peptidase M24 [Desulfoplanes formicivorans]
MTFTSLEQLPLAEHEFRIRRLKELLIRTIPQASGILVFARLNIYYLTGSWVNGLVWIPRDGEPVLLCRKGIDRARLDSPMTNMGEYRSFGQLQDILQDFEAPMGSTVAVDMTGLPWSLGRSLQKHLGTTTLVPGDHVLAKTRAIKSPWELTKMRRAGEIHNHCLCHILPHHLRPGMNEREISLKIWEVFMEHGHCGMMRMEHFGEEIFLGHVAAGDSGNYPSVFNGPVGLRGVHPVIPHMGDAGTVWHKHQPLTLDCGFCLDGYHSDKTQIYWDRNAIIPDQARKAQDFCLEIQTWIAERLRPGAIPSQLFTTCWQKARNLGHMEGFMGLGGNKVRFIGHGIGLAIDEYPVIAQGFDEPLEEGMTMALEPKIGIPGLGMVGVENTFEITPDGGKCLTGRIFDPIMI